MLQLLESQGTAESFDAALKLIRRLLEVDAVEFDMQIIQRILQKQLVRLVLTPDLTRNPEEIRNLLLKAKAVETRTGEILFAEVLGEVLNGHFDAFLEWLGTRETSLDAVLSAGLICFAAFKRCHDLLPESKRPLVQGLVSDCHSIASLCPTEVRASLSFGQETQPCFSKG